jgi:hypothetical protein
MPFREKVSNLSVRQDKRFKILDKDIQAIVKFLLDTRDTQSEDLRRHFEALAKSEKTEHAKTRAAFVNIDGKKRRDRVELDILESLRFPMMNDRYERLAEAHENTFKWIFQDPKIYHKPWDNFVEWLFLGHGIYWIQGKAASGKSTLMRFIWNNALTLQILRRWSGSSQLIVAAFFFWNSGIPEQRSQRGLLRSLLFEALRKNKDLIPDVLPNEWENKSALAAHDLPIRPETWSLAQLQMAFRRLVGLASPQLKLCLFVDGLDEYDGDAQDIAQYFKELSTCADCVKFCLSSRPWPVFREIYGGTPMLEVQDMTRDDIRLYVSDKLEKNRHMQRLLAEDPENASELIEEVTEKAAGVFLWVVLVVKSLVGGLVNGDRISHLRRRLASLPADLEALYEHMLNGIDPFYAEEASQIFQIFRASGHSLDIPTLERSIRFSDYRQAIELEVMEPNMLRAETEKIIIGLEMIIRRLESRCKGLLEALEDDSTPKGELALYSLSNQSRSSRYERFQNAKRSRPPEMRLSMSTPGLSSEIVVDKDAMSSFTITKEFEGQEFSQPLLSKFPRISYLHRTVKDYLEKPPIWKAQLDKTKDTGFDPHVALLSSYVIELKTTDFMVHSKSFESNGEQIFSRVKELEPFTSKHQVLLVDELSRTLKIHWDRENQGRDSSWPQCTGTHWPKRNTSWDFVIYRMRQGSQERAPSELIN